MENEESLMEKYYTLSNKKKVKILEIAIYNMQRYNGRSYETCITLAMIELNIPTK